MSNTITNKAGIQPIPTDRYAISTSDVVKYLQDQLGVPVIYDFTRWIGAHTDSSYVRMRVCFNPDDIMAKVASTDYADRVLAENAAGINFKDHIMNTLKPFMYPDTIGDIRNRPQDLERLFELGLYEERLSEILNFAKLTYCKEANLFRLYLRPERIIVDMLSNPKTNKVNGELSILSVHGTTSETIRWEVAVTKSRTVSTSSSVLSLDAIFK